MFNESTNVPCPKCGEPFRFTVHEEMIGRKRLLGVHQIRHFSAGCELDNYSPVGNEDEDAKDARKRIQRDLVGYTRTMLGVDPRVRVPPMSI